MIDTVILRHGLTHDLHGVFKTRIYTDEHGNFKTRINTVGYAEHGLKNEIYAFN